MSLRWPRVLSILTATLAPLVLAAAGRQSEHPTQSAESGPLKAKVEKLLQSLETGSTPGQRTAAEWDLLRLGPAVLPLLPVSDSLPVPVKEQLTALSATLEELRPRTWTIAKKQMPLSQALELLKAQTKMALVDRRQTPADAQVTVDFKDAVYWEVVESLARQANARLALYQSDGQVALVDGPARPLSMVVSGPFRIAVTGVGAHLDFETHTHVGKLSLEVAWEPRFQPFLMEVGHLSLHAAKHGQHEPFTADAPGHGPVFAAEHNAKEFAVQFPGPPRSVGVLDEVTGQVVVTMPSKLLTFTFKDLATNKKSQTEPGGVTVSVTGLNIEADRWTVELTVAVPAAGPKLDSFQQWLGGKSWLDRITCQLDRLVNAKKEEVRPDPLRTQVPVLSATQAVVRFQFNPQRMVGVKDFSKWRLTCKVPGRLVEMTVPFQFRGIELP